MFDNLDVTNIDESFYFCDMAQVNAPTGDTKHENHMNTNEASTIDTNTTSRIEHKFKRTVAELVETFEEPANGTRSTLKEVGELQKAATAQKWLIGTTSKRAVLSISPQV